MSTLGERMVAAAKALIGVPWRHLGRDERGLDCVGLLVVSARAVGLEVDDFIGYGRHSTDHSMLDKLTALGARMSVAEPWQPGDVLVFTDARYPGHCGLYAGDGQVVHCSAIRRRVTMDRVATVGGVVVAVYRPGL